MSRTMVQVGDSVGYGHRREAPWISVVIATKNSSTTLAEALDGLRRQSYDAFEVIIADGASTDGTLDLVSASSDVVTRWSSARDSSVYQAWNRAIPLCRGTWIHFHGSDDELASSASLGEVAQCLLELGPRARLAYGTIAVHGPDGRLVKLLGEDWQQAKARLLEGMPLPHPGAFHHRKIFSEVGLFDERFRIAGDYEFLLRAVPHTTPIFLGIGPILRMKHGGLSTRPDMRTLMMAESKIARVRLGHAQLIHAQGLRGLRLPFFMAREAIRSRLNGRGRVASVLRGLVALRMDIAPGGRRA